MSASDSVSVSGEASVSGSESLPPYSPVIETIDGEVFFDASTSMLKSAKKGSKSKQTRFEQGEEVGLDLLKDFLKVDDDGIEMGYFNRTFKTRHVTSVDEARALYETIEDSVQSGTKMAPLLRDRFADFKKVYRKSKRRRVIVIITDGMTKDFDEVIAAIREMAEWEYLPDHKALGIMFVLAGDSKGGKEMMETIDDNKVFPPLKYDLVDCKTIEWMEAEGRTLADVIAQAFDD